MVEINATVVKELREITNVGMMECKRALQETGGDMERAIQLLRERGKAVATKKASRAANQGLVSADVFDQGRTGVMIEINCETDFVARNDGFISFVREMLEKARELDDGELAEAERETLVSKIQEIGENMKIARNVRFQVAGEGLVASYVHLGGKVGVLLEMGCGKPETATHPAVLETAKDLTLHIAACNPQYIRSDEVPETVIAAEREIFVKQAEGKPANVVEMMVEGKIKKFLAQICLIEQGFVKDPDQSVQQLLDSTGKVAGDVLEIRRFARFQLGG